MKNSKIYNYNDFSDSVYKGKVAVLASGAFDLLHPGHVEFLSKAKELGDILIVGVESDLKVNEAKGSGRPILSQADRAKLVAALAVVDYVVPLSYVAKDDYLDIIQKIGCTILAVTKGDPFLNQKIAVMAKANGKVLEVMERLSAYSSTSMVKKASATQGDSCVISTDK